MSQQHFGSRATKDFALELERRGWRIAFGKRHVQAYYPGGGMLTISSTPGSQRWEHTVRAQARRVERA